MFRQTVIVAFVLGTMLNVWVFVGAAGGYKYYGNVLPLDVAGASRFALGVELVLILLAILAWWLSRAKKVT